MEKVCPWCGQLSDRGRLKNRTEHYMAKLKTTQKQPTASCNVLIEPIAESWPMFIFFFNLLENPFSSLPTENFLHSPWHLSSFICHPWCQCIVTKHIWISDHLVFTENWRNISTFSVITTKFELAPIDQGKGAQTRVEIEPKSQSLIGSHVWAFDWNKSQWPWMTFSGQTHMQSPITNK